MRYIVLIIMMINSIVSGESIIQKTSLFAQQKIEHIKRNMQTWHRYLNQQKIPQGAIIGVSCTAAVIMAYVAGRLRGTYQLAKTVQDAHEPRKSFALAVEDGQELPWLKKEHDLRNQEAREQMKIVLERRMKERMQKQTVPEKVCFEFGAIGYAIDAQFKCIISLTIEKSADTWSLDLQRQLAENQQLIAEVVQKNFPKVKVMHLKIDNKIWYTWDYVQYAQDEHAHKMAQFQEGV